MDDKQKQALREERAPLLREGTVALVPRARRAKREETPLEEEREGELTDEEKAAREEALEEEARADAAAAADGDAEVEVAFSSEGMVERYDWMTERSYFEVLGHEADEIDLGYARDGLPFFVGHDGRDMVGIVEDIRLGSDKKLRGRVRFSKSARAQEIRQDILDGIRKKISVGYDYAADQFTENVDEEGRTIRRYRGWRPLEVSSVPIPADYEVGVGRTARPGARRPDFIPGAADKAKEQTVSQNGQAAESAESVRAGIDAANQEIVALAKQHNMSERLGEWIGQRASVDTVRAEILKHYQERSTAVVRAGGEKGPIDFSVAEAQTYSFARAIKSQIDGTACFEREVSDEMYKRLKKERTNPNGMLVPTALLGRALMVAGQRNMAVANTTAGQALRFDEFGGFLEILRNRMLVGQFGATFLSGLQGDLSFVTNPSANTFQWGAETANPTATFLGTGIKTMAPKSGAALTKYTRQLMAQSAYSIESTVQNDLMKIVALAIDRASIIAGGGSAPVGILGTTGIGAVTLGTAGGAITFDKLVDLETEVAADNADFGSLGYMVTPRVRGVLRKTQEFSGTNGMPIWTQGADGMGEIAGYKAGSTNQVPNNLTKGSNTGVLHAAIFGDWSDLIIAEWGAVELVVDPYTSKPALIEVAAHTLVDVMVRYPEKFASIQDIVVP